MNMFESRHFSTFLFTDYHFRVTPLTMSRPEDSHTTSIDAAHLDAAVTQIKTAQQVYHQAWIGWKLDGYPVSEHWAIAMRVAYDALREACMELPTRYHDESASTELDEMLLGLWTGQAWPYQTIFGEMIERTEECAYAATVASMTGVTPTIQKK